MIIIHLDPKDQNINTSLNINLYHYEEKDQENLIWELTKYIPMNEVRRIWPDFGKAMKIYEGVIEREENNNV